MTNLENTGYIISHHIPIFLAVNHGKLHEFQSDPGLSGALPAGGALPAAGRTGSANHAAWNVAGGARAAASGGFLVPWFQP